MTITVTTRYDQKKQRVYHLASTSDDPDIEAEGDNVEAALLKLEDMIREEYHPDRTPLRLRDEEAEFLRTHEIEP